MDFVTGLCEDVEGEAVRSEIETDPDGGVGGMRRACRKGVEEM